MKFKSNMKIGPSTVIHNFRSHPETSLKLPVKVAEGGEAMCLYNITLMSCSCYHCCCGKATSVTYSGCVSVAFVSQHAKCMCHIIHSSVACLVIPCFLTLLHDFQKNFIEHKMCVLIFSTTFVWNISHSKKKSVRY